MLCCTGTLPSPTLPTRTPLLLLPPCATFHEKKKMLLLFLFSFRSFPQAKEAISLSLSLSHSLSPPLSPSLPKTDGRHFRRSRCSTILDKKRPSWTCLSADAEDRETKFRSVSVSAFFSRRVQISADARERRKKKISTNFYFFSHVDV